MIWIDLVIVGALLLGLGLGAKRGFLQTLGGVAATVVSFIGAGIAAGAFSGTVAKWIRPLLEKKMQSGGISGGSAASMVREAGFFGETAQRIVDSVGTLVQETKESLVAAVTDGIAQSVAYALVYLAAFLILMLVCRLLLRVLRLAERLPELGGRRRSGLGRCGIAGIFCRVAAAETAAGYHGGYGAAICPAAIFREPIPYGLAHVPVKP